ncbi:hypothetical protein HHL26_06740 [Sphingobium sp. TB-6]|uniref:gp53-like domain-containing protein n=1 Tax=Sphingobium sp. TB-6 TaxID=2728850 RepID=UPI00146E61AC|nr:hypothetical protein [Sphingobium sp. TB-6]NML88763.1 hypothetical protein [Sphingobium sp. TB-6]
MPFSEIDILPDPPQRDSDPDTFADRADIFVVAMQVLSQQLNVFIAELQTAAALIAAAPAYADPGLVALSGLTPAADRLAYFTGTGSSALTNLTAVARTLLAQTSQANMRTVGLGLGTAAMASYGDFEATGSVGSAMAAHVAASDPHAQYLLESAVSSFIMNLLNDPDQATALTTLGALAVPTVTSNANGICIATTIGGVTYLRQWGRVTCAGNSTGTLTFPVAFTDATKVSCIMNGTSDPSNFGQVSRGPTIYSNTDTTASWSNGDDSSATGFWIAEGY